MARLMLTIGCSGSGKSTWSKGKPLDFGVVRLSSDELRGIIGKDESDQTVSGQVFRTMETVTEHLLLSGYEVLIDATNYRPKNRAEFIRIARKVGAKIEAYCFDVPLDILKSRNRSRDRVVPEDVIERQFNGLQWPVKGVEVDEVIFIK